MQLGEDQNRWHLTIIDHGTGFDQAQVRAGGAGAGLVNMRDRLDAVGGTVTVGSLSGWGTTVAAVVPYFTRFVTAFPTVASRASWPDLLRTRGRRTTIRRPPNGSSAGADPQR